MTSFLLYLYQFMLRLYPGRFYATFGPEMVDVFAEKLRHTDGSWARLMTFSRELRDWPVRCLQEHWAVRQTMLNYPVSHKLSWRGTAVAALPYLLMALLFGIVYLVAALFSDGSASLALYNSATAVVLVIFMIVLAVAWWRKWPGWSVSWLGFLAFITFYVLLPQYLLQTEFARNTPSRLLQIIATEVILQLLLYGIFYWLAGQWPVVGAVVLLPPVGFSWLLSMEFVPENVTFMIFVFTWCLLAAVSVLMIRWGNGRWHGWLLGLAALIIGLVSAYAGQFWLELSRLEFGGINLEQNTVSGMGMVWDTISLAPVMDSLLSKFAPTLLPLLAILLLLALRRKLVMGNGRSALRHYRALFWGIVGLVLASQVAQRLFLPDDLAAFRPGAGVVLTAVCLLSLLGFVWGAWRLRHSQFGWLLLTLVILFPFIYQAGAITNLLGELPFFKLSNSVLPYETVRLVGRVVGFVWLGLSTWLLGQLSPLLPEDNTAPSMAR